MLVAMGQIVIMDFGDRILKEAPRFNLILLVPPSGSLWIVPYKAKSGRSDVLSSLSNNSVIIILLFSSVIIPRTIWLSEDLPIR